MEYLVIFMTLVSVLWLLHKLRQGPPDSTPGADSPIKAGPGLQRPARLGHGLDVLIPTNNDQGPTASTPGADSPVQARAGGKLEATTPTLLDEDMSMLDEEVWPIPETEPSDLPPAPPSWSEAELDSLSTTRPEFVAPALPDESDDSPYPEETPTIASKPRVLSDEEAEQAVQEALTDMQAAGLFRDYPDLHALSQEITLRCDSQTADSLFPSASTFRWSYWHSYLRTSPHSWLDQLMLLGFGPEAGYALHNAFHKGFTAEAFTNFGEACRQLSVGSLQVETILWQQVDEQAYQLRVDEQVAIYDITRQPLSKVPLQFVRMLNAKLPDQERRFEVFTLLPLFGETLVFYLNREQKATLESKRGWQFFDWNSLEEGAA